MVIWRRFKRRLGVALNLREPPSVPPYGWSYFDHLISLYVTMNCSDSRADAVIKKAKEEPDDLTWGDIFLLENIVFSLAPDDVVNRNAWIVRERFREIAGPTVYEKYLDSGFPRDCDTPAKLALLKADLTRLIDVLHWYYSLIPLRERMRRSLTVRCILYVIFYTAAYAGLLLLCRCYGAEFFAMVTGIVYWGILGGFVSSQRRMERIPNDGDPLISVFGLADAGYYLWLSPLLGAIFAMVLALMFISGILTGAVFPSFYSPTARHHNGLTFFTFTWSTLPVSSAEYAKLYVWAFLAGFAERLVPDSLDRLSSKLSAEERRKGSMSAIPPLPGGQKSPEYPESEVALKERSTPVSAEALSTAIHTGQTASPGHEATSGGSHDS